MCAVPLSVYNELCWRVRRSMGQVSLLQATACRATMQNVICCVCCGLTMMCDSLNCISMSAVRESAVVRKAEWAAADLEACDTTPASQARKSRSTTPVASVTYLVSTPCFVSCLSLAGSTGSDSQDSVSLLRSASGDRLPMQQTWCCSMVNSDFVL